MNKKVVFVRGRDRTIVWILSSIPILVMFAPLWFVFNVYTARGMQIQGQLDLFAFTKVG